MSKKHKNAKKEQRQSLYTPTEAENVELEEKAEVITEALEEEKSEETQNDVAETENAVVTEDKEPKKDEKSKKEEKSKDSKKEKDKKKGKKENKRGLIKKTKETASELKKVTWPSFADVVKKTGIVIAFVIIFGLLIFGVDMLLSWLVGLLV